jgi:hypothetical protein
MDLTSRRHVGGFIGLMAIGKETKRPMARTVKNS